MDDSDDDNDLFGADSDSDDTADLIQTSAAQKKGKLSAKKPTTKKSTPKPSNAGEGGLFDSDSDDADAVDEDNDDLGNVDAKKKRLEALAQKRKKKETNPASPSNKSSKRRKAGSVPKKGDKGYESGESYDSNEIQRTADDDAFIDTAGEDPDAVNEFYEEQRFADDRPDKSAQKKKKRRVQGQQDDDANDPIMSVVNRMKKKKKEKKSDSAIEDEVNAFLRQMALAAERDETAISERKPALNKLNMLSDVCTMLTVKDMQRPLLEADLLAACKRWIAPLPNGSLGNITVRTRILESIAKMPVHSNDLKRSEFGKVVMMLYKHPDETPALKRQLKKLIEEWSRPIFRKSDKMRDLERFERPSVPTHATAAGANGPNRSIQKAAKQDLNSLIASGKSKEATLTASQQRVQVPYSRGFSYQVRPAARSSPAQPAAAQASTGDIRDKLKRRMVEKGRKVSKNQRSANLSVEGRATK